MSDELSVTPRRTLTVLVVLLLLVVLSAFGVVAAGANAEPTPEPPSVAQPEQGGNPSEAGVQESNRTMILHTVLRGRGLVEDQEGIVADHPGYPYVWESESLELRATIRSSSSSSSTFHLCGRFIHADGEESDRFDCATAHSSAMFRSLTLELEEWPSGASGDRSIEIELLEARPRGANGTNATEQSGNRTVENVTVDVRERRVFVINKEGDIDGDGLTNAREVDLGTDFTRTDTDEDGLTDWEEVHMYGTGPLKTDTTGDGVSDGTIARFGLPPTVPYILHALAIGAVVLVTLVGLAAVKLRSWLRNIQQVHHTGSMSSEVDPPPATDGTTTPTTKEEEIITILHRHGGQMRQTDLVEESEWSKATVSRLLSSLEDEGHIEKIRIGRGNVVKLLDSALENEWANVSG